MTASLVGVALVGVLGGTILVFLAARSLLTDQINDRLLSTASSRALAVDRWVLGLHADIQYAAQVADLRDLVTRLREEPGSTEARRALEEALGRIDPEGAQFRSIWVELTPEMQILASTDPARSGAYLTQPTVPAERAPGPYIREVHASSEGGTPTITVAAPIRDEGGVPGAYLVGHLDFTQLGTLLDAPLGFGGAAETYVVSEWGDRITTESVGQEDYPRGLVSPGIRSALARETGVRAYPNYRGEGVLGAYTWLPERQMALLVELPESAALAPARRLAALSLAGGLAMVVLLGALGGNLARQIVAPLERLAAAATRVAAGDFTARVEPSGGTEVATLADSFNRMVDRVEMAYLELREQVEVTSEALGQVQSAGALLQSVTDNSPGLVATVTPDGRLSLVNRRFAGLFPSTAPLVGQWIEEVVPEPVMRAFAKAREEALTGREGAEAHFTVPGPDGEPVHFDVSVFPLSVEAGAAGDVGMIALDRTAAVHSQEERARLEVQLRATQKLESLGVLAGGIAHDFNNLLQAMMGHASLLEKLKLTPEADEALRQIRSAGSRASALTSQLLAYAGQRALRLERVPVNELVVDLGELVQVSLPRSARLDLELSTDAGAVMADPSQLSQVILNLLTNAGDSLKDGRGWVVARTERVPLGPRRTRGQPTAQALPNGDYLRFTVQDDGVGMTPETLDRIFDPFFTTKQAGRGLGLAAVSGIVRSCGGLIEVESRVGEGTTFKVFLPRVARDVAPVVEEDDDEPGSPELSGRTLLVAEDEGGVRRFVEQALQLSGARVISAEDGDVALRLIREHLPELDGLILDLTMPGRGGVEVLKEAWQLRPDLPTLISSGFDLADSLGELAEDPRVRILHKPYRMDGLLEAVRLLFQPKSASEAAQTR
jgi:signal transduction histidine kinase/ActR/RegA family two-component response regulator